MATHNVFVTITHSVAVDDKVVAAEMGSASKAHILSWAREQVSSPLGFDSKMEISETYPDEQPRQVKRGRGSY